MDETNPTVRALLALEVLQDHPGITADRLARALQVSERAARRYVSILREAGIPVEATRGRYGGYRLGRGLRLPPLHFGAAEALALVMAVLDGHHDAADPTGLVGAALGKIIRALPDSVAGQAEAVRKHTALTPHRGAARPDPQATTDLVRACVDRRRVSLDYSSPAGAHWSALVDPWAVVVRHGRWYLLCWSHRAGARRAYRVDRVQAVRVEDESFVSPEDLDPVADLEAHLAVGWEHDVEVEVELDLATARSRVPRVLGRLEAIDEHACRLFGSTSNPAAYAADLAQLPAPWRIVQGDEVRNCVQELSERLARAAAVR